MEPIHESKHAGFKVRVYASRIEYGIWGNTQTIPISQIASVSVPMAGLWTIMIETTGGKNHTIPTRKKKEIKAAIDQAMAAK